MNSWILWFGIIGFVSGAIHYEIKFSFAEKLQNWRKQLDVHDRMPATYVRFLAFKKLIKDFNPIQDEMLQASLEAETNNDQGVKESIIQMSTEANKEIEKRLVVHKPFLEAIKKAIHRP